MERFFFLSNRLTLGIFGGDSHSQPVLVVVLSILGDVVHLLTSSTTETHITKCCPSKYLPSVMKTLEFKNAYDPYSSYVCSRFHGKSAWEPHTQVDFCKCPFGHRLSGFVPVLYYEETATGLTWVENEYCAYLQKIISARQRSPALLCTDSMTTSETFSSTSIATSQTRPQISSLHADGAAELLEFSKDLAEEYSLMSTLHYYPSNCTAIVESLNGIIYINISATEGSIDQEFQIWFQPPDNFLNWQSGEIVTLARDIVRHQFVQNSTEVRPELQESEKNQTLIKIDQSYSLSVLELPFDDESISTDAFNLFKRKSEITHLLLFREHSTRMKSHSSSSIMMSNRSSQECYALWFYLLSDGVVRGMFPRDDILIEYLPDVRSIHVTLPSGRQQIYSVDWLLKFRNDRKLSIPENPNSLLYLLISRLIQLLSFRRRALNSMTCDPFEETRLTSIEVAISQYRNRKFLSQVDSLLSESS